MLSFGPLFWAATRVVFLSSMLADLVAVLAKAEREGVLREKIRFLCRCSLLVVDEIGYLPVTPGAAICSSSSSMPATKRGR